LNFFKISIMNITEKKQMSVKRLLSLKNLTVGFVLFLVFLLICTKNENTELKAKIEQIEKEPPQDSLMIALLC